MTERKLHYKVSGTYMKGYTVCGRIWSVEKTFQVTTDEEIVNCKQCCKYLKRRNNGLHLKIRKGE